MTLTRDFFIYMGVDILVWMIVLVSAVFLGKTITLKVLEWAKVPAPRPRVVAGADAATLLAGAEEERAVLRGGLWIGILERIAVAACMMGGQPALISLILGVKGLGRYPELKDNPEASERFLIGTGASILSAIAIGALGYAAVPAIVGLIL
ncbi:hypothetical protein [Schaalia sp. Marseille-Q2122]|uniref:hypothetical protein n=1 Tax=Schaalia sp. Marseille-Q2122 TaxID=2736604 RepID=UPI001C377D0F|nr:hypothetical protein [Schaalia sp. Marseille-Q2122]